ncbi:MAG TPA: DUF481 domain-containing protein [Ignavibacteria bacterium]|jgi:hypothetical protein
MKKILLLLFVITAILESQVVNIESKRMRSDTVGWLGSAEGNFQLAKNVETIFDLGGKLHFQFKQKNYLWLFLNEYRLIKGGDNKFVNSAFAHIRYNHKITKELLRWEIFTQVQYNGVLDIGLRWLAGTGPRIKIYDSDIFRLYVASLYMYEYEENTEKTIFLRNHRMSSYITFTIDLGRAEFINTSYYQPNLRDFDDDYRVQSQTDLLIDITENLKFKTGFTYRYDSNPFPDIPKTTYSLSNGLVFEF